MTGADDLAEIARRVCAVRDKTALLDGREVTRATPLPIQEHPESTGGDRAPVPRVRPHSDGDEGTEISWLANQIYGHCYVRPMPRSSATADSAAIHAFRLSLSVANAGQGHWEHGWQLADSGEDEAGIPARPRRRLVRRYGIRFATTSDRVRLDGSTTRAAVLVPKERRNLHPGYYVALGDAMWPIPRSEPLIRVYWNITARGAASWVAAVTELANRAEIPFLAKVRDHPDGHGRADSAVLYLPAGVDDTVQTTLSDVHSAIAEHLLDGVPMFTRTLAVGVGAAIDPDDGLSFGQSRCELVAKGLRSHALSGRPDSEEERYAAICAAFGAAGIDPDQAHQTTSHAGLLQAVTSLASSDRRAASVRPALSQMSTRRDPLEIAASIGDLLCRTAYWDSSRRSCTWVGRRPDITAYAHGRTPGPIATSLSGRLYDGLAGIALFLAELSALTGDRRHLQTAVAAAENAGRQTQAANESDSQAAGLFTGVCGVAWAARRVAVRAPEIAPLADELDRRAARTIEGLTDWQDDIIAGRAGVILTLLARDGSSARIETERSNVATALGRDLLASLASQRMLTGMAHGASGFGAGLLHLYSRTGSEEFLHAGRAVLAWEDALFDDSTGAWPDLRDPRVGAAPRDRAAVTWCNGAAGIAVARVMAAVKDPELRSSHAAVAAKTLQATRSALSRTRPEDDNSLCHGSAGLADVLLIASQVLDDRELAAEARDSMLELIACAPWRTDAVDLVRTNPNLMLGAAGIGHVLLRLHAPSAVPSVLDGLMQA